MSPRPDVSDERKSQIINAAEGVFTKKGFDEARMDDIAEETGLSKGTLYLYFKSKDDLIIAILDRMFQREFKQLESLEQEDLSATDAIWKLTDLLTKDILSMIRLVPIVYQFLALAFRNKYVQKALKQYINRYLGILIPIVQRGIDAGEFREVDARETAIAMGAIIEGTLLLWVYDKSLIEPEVHIRSGMKLLLEGVQAHA
ncbi:MAG: TetR/AcrR family transcriptional regulator [Anaerolineales bacterium]|nr:TetR/AcrR family transcriptional regulator [Anaerolineales bacterium]MCB9112250.1 TetR/AcrR family transcriptional regulator [Anaerolineales bacterium]